MPRPEDLEARAVAKCIDCIRLDQFAEPCPPHVALLPCGTRERATRGLGVIRWDEYHCSSCGSRWVRQTDDLGQYWFES
ncbi:MAG: hypothetical protein AB1651_10060 [Pseudomonadota bacterium]